MPEPESIKPGDLEVLKPESSGEAKVQAITPKTEKPTQTNKTPEAKPIAEKITKEDLEGISKEDKEELKTTSVKQETRINEVQPEEETVQPTVKGEKKVTTIVQQNEAAKKRAAYIAKEREKALISQTTVEAPELPKKKPIVPILIASFFLIAAAVGTVSYLRSGQQLKGQVDETFLAAAPEECQTDYYYDPAQPSAAASASAALLMGAVPSAQAFTLVELQQQPPPACRVLHGWDCPATLPVVPVAGPAARDTDRYRL